MEEFELGPPVPLDELGLCASCLAGIEIARATRAGSFTLCPACVQILDPGHDCNQHHHSPANRRERRRRHR